ncbi:MAG: hypothetical protein Q9180_006962, partial [Flavoplaca navasiana]
MSLFGQAASAASTSNPFGSTTSSLFGNNQQNQTATNSFLNPGNQTNSSQGDTKSLFGSLGQPAQQSSLFGAGGLFSGQSKPQPQQTSSLFGNPQQPSNTQNTSNTQQSSSLFGAKALGQGQSSLFGGQQPQQQQPQSSLFGATQQQPQQQLPQQGSVFGQPNASIFKQLEVWP